MDARIAIPLLAWAWLAGAEIIDRVAVVVGLNVITASEIEREVRLTEFLNSEPLDLAVEKRRKAAARLVEQKLIRRELEMGRYPTPQAADVQALVTGIRKSRFQNEAAYRKALGHYGVTEEDLKKHLLWQLTVMRFIELRFRPGIQVEEEDLAKELARRAQTGGSASPVREEVREQVEEQLIGQRVDRQLEQWLKSAVERTRVEYREAVFR